MILIFKKNDFRSFYDGYKTTIMETPLKLDIIKHLISYLGYLTEMMWSTSDRDYIQKADLLVNTLKKLDEISPLVQQAIDEYEKSVESFEESEVEASEHEKKRTEETKAEKARWSELTTKEQRKELRRERRSIV